MNELIHSIPPWVMLGLGLLAGCLKSAWNFIYQHTVGHVLKKVSLTLSVEDNGYRDAYDWLNSWVEERLKKQGIHSVILRYRDEEKNHFMVPDYGTYYLKWSAWQPMIVTHTVSDKGAEGRRPIHKISITIYLCRNRAVLEEILQEAKSQHHGLDQRLSYYESDRWGEWSLNKIPTRTFDSVYLPEGVRESVCQDIEIFLKSKPRYEMLGIPYRRGYQFSGPPGTGKSTFILALATHFQLPIYALKINGKDTSREDLSRALKECKTPCIVLLEDIDCVTVATSREGETEEGVTLSDLLNLFDGAGATEGRLIFMTANHPERIDPALVRTGRIDRKIEVSYANDLQLRAFYDRAAPLFDVAPWQEFRAALPEKATIADAQALAFSGA